MKKISIYIDTLYAGMPACGEGAYSIVLEYIGRRGEIATKVHYARWIETTRNRLAIRALTEALSCVKEPCQIMAFINNPLLVTMVNEGMFEKWQTSGWIGSRGDTVKNADLLQGLAEQIMKGHALTLVNQKETSYSRYMRYEVQKRREKGLLPDRKDRECKQERWEEAI